MITRIPAHVWFVLLCLAWLLPGLVGHVPWRGADDITFAAFLQAREQATWLLPDASLSPLYLWIAQLFAQTFSVVLPLHDAVRLASGALAASALWLTALAAQRLYGREAGWPAVFALMGCVGLLVPAHEINPHIVQLAAMSLFLYGLVRMLSDTLIGGGLAGLGLVALFLAGAWLPALGLAVALLLLPVVFPSWRTSARVGSSWFALLVALTIAGMWLLSVQSRAPELLVAWWQTMRSDVVFLGGHGKPQYFVEALAWFGWPAWPVAGWAVYRLQREGWDSVKLWIPLGGLVVMFAALSLYADPKQIQSLILLPPLALLTGAGLAELRRGAANALMWFAVMTFSVIALVFWAYWAAFDLDWPRHLAKRLAKLGMEGEGLRTTALLLGALITLVWVIGLGWIRRQPRVPQRPILVWSAGLTFIWCLLLALFMQPLDKRLGYAELAAQIRQQVAPQVCVQAKNTNATQRTLLAYHSGLKLHIDEDSRCGWLLLGGKSQKEKAPGKGWQKQWEGGRPGDKGERFWLYRRTGDA